MIGEVADKEVGLSLATGGTSAFAADGEDLPGLEACKSVGCGGVSLWRWTDL